MEILEAVHAAADRAVFVVVVDGRRTELPWVEHVTLRDGILVLEGVSSGSGSPATTWVRVWEQAAWQVSLGEEAEAPRGRRVRAADPEASTGG